MGVRVPVVSKYDFSFDGRTSTTQQVVLARRIDTVDFVSLVLEVWLHSKGSWSATAQAVVAVQNVVIPVEEPQTSFLEGSGSTDLASVTIAASDGAPRLYLARTSTTPGQSVRVVLRFSQGGTTAGGAQDMSLGIALVGRDA
jgi:hypothetical protein